MTQKRSGPDKAAPGTALVAEDTAPLVLNQDEVRKWLRLLHAGSPGRIHIAATDVWSGPSFPTDDIDGAVRRVAELDAVRPMGVYVRMTTLMAPLARGQRGGNADSLALPALWADIDIAGAAHVETNLPPDWASAEAVVQATPLPCPSLWIDSGHGAYPIWLLDPVHVLTADSLAAAADLSTNWQKVIEAGAASLGWRYGAGVGDLARVLRIPGTVNRKAGTERMCSIVADSVTDDRYTVAELMDYCADAMAAVGPQTSTRTVTTVSTCDTEPGEVTPWDAYAAKTSWAEVLLPHGWQLDHQRDGTEYWCRPGKEAGRGDVSATVNALGTDRFHVFSTSTDFETTSYGKVGALAVLEHHGDIDAAIAALTASGYGTRAEADARVEAWMATLPDAPPRAVATSVAPLAGRVGGGLPFVTLADMCRAVDSAGPRKWLLQGLWPAGDYGVHAADMKAQKTWNTVDLAVSVASNTPWLGSIEVGDPGPVLMFAGEGGEADLVRRIRGVCASRKLTAEDLPITICARAPHLSNINHLAQMAAAIVEVRPRLVTLDPLYLAARGASGGQLYEMGAMLEGPQHICQAAGASLFVVTHQNRQQGRGAARITGAGPAEWGRVLITATVISRTADADKQTTVVTELDVLGGPGGALRVLRRIRADNPDDLDSLLNYAVEVTDVDAEAASDQVDGGMPPARAKLLGALRDLGRPSTSRQLVDWIVEHHGHPLKRETASRELNHLLKAKLIDSSVDPGRESQWFLVDTP